MNQDVECVVCAETLKGRDFPDCGVTGTCTHEATTCNSCIAQHIRVQLETRTWRQLTCPECPAPMAYADVQRFATAEIFQRYDALAMRDGITTDAQFRWCPAPNCESGQIHNEGADAPIITCVACGARSCFTHQRLWHEGLTCEEFETGVSPSSRKRRLTAQERADQEMATRLQQQEEENNRAAAAQLQRERDLAAERERQEEEANRKAREAQELLARQRAEERASEREILGISKKCPGRRCSWRIQKNDGCDHMTCKPLSPPQTNPTCFVTQQLKSQNPPPGSRCGHQFCWECLASWNKISMLGNAHHQRSCKYHSSNLR
jgi:IBR domain, a half RING-finger domain